MSLKWSTYDYIINEVSYCLNGNWTHNLPITSNGSTRAVEVGLRGLSDGHYNLGVFAKYANNPEPNPIDSCSFVIACPP